jgi:hypothetical protein
MSSAASPPSPRLCATRSRSIRHVPGSASLPSFASSAPHDSCNAMQSGAVGCSPDDATERAMTQPMTQTQAAGGRNDARGRDGRLAATSPGAGRQRSLPVPRAVSPTSPDVCARRVVALPGDQPRQGAAGANVAQRAGHGSYLATWGGTPPREQPRT